MKSALVLGAGGFIGSHMVNRLKSEGYYVTGVDLKYPEFEETKADRFFIKDLSHYEDWIDFDITYQEIYQFAADMGGAGYIFTKEHDFQVMLNSILINANLCRKIKETNWFPIYPKIFYSSSACMYPQEIQEKTNDVSLKEEYAYPANLDSEYGWEKLFSERLYLAGLRNLGLDVRIARFHNIYGTHSCYNNGKEKAPAAMCRKVIQAQKLMRDISYIEVWGDGKQTRSFLYIDDCIDAVRLLMQSDFKEPINIGSEEMVSINQLAQMAIDISGKKVVIQNDLTNKALGVRGRNSNNDLIRKVLGWEPKYTLKEGLTKTYQWIESQVKKEKE